MIYVTETENEIHKKVLPRAGHNSEKEVQWKLGARSLCLVSHMASWSPKLEPYPAVFQGSKFRAGSEAEWPEHKPVPLYDASTMKLRISLLFQIVGT